MSSKAELNQTTHPHTITHDSVSASPVLSLIREVMWVLADKWPTTDPTEELGSGDIYEA